MLDKNMESRWIVGIICSEYMQDFKRLTERITKLLHSLINCLYFQVIYFGVDDEMKDIKRGFVGILLWEIAVLLLKDKKFQSKLQKTKWIDKFSLVTKEIVNTNIALSKWIQKYDFAGSIKKLENNLIEWKSSLLDNVDELLNQTSDCDIDTQAILQKFQKSLTNLDIKQKFWIY